ncbi:MAG: RnfABCDGE type electron transport complex subunit B [Acidobacteria bacterium]|nr:RnfABCDGE type electron transport complex subunit B [Acidobacteriota bacterium]
MSPDLLIAVAAMGGLGLFFAAALAVADKKLRVEENPMIGRVHEVLPGANCGACGYAGCYDFAVQVVEGNAACNGCPVGGQDTADEVAAVVGIESVKSVRMVARVLCRGGRKEARNKETAYIGPGGCSVQNIVSGGNKVCIYGCLGGGDCVAACAFNAIYMNGNGLPAVVDEFCTGCGMCAAACPRNIIEIHPIDRDVFVFCKNHDGPKEANVLCDASCIGCGICARKSGGAISMTDNLAIIDYEKLDPETIPFDKCRSGAIGYLPGRAPAREAEMEESREVDLVKKIRPFSTTGRSIRKEPG